MRRLGAWLIRAPTVRRRPAGASRRGSHRRLCDIALNRAITGRNPGNRIPICVPIEPSPPEYGCAGANLPGGPARSDENRDTVRPLATAPVIHGLSGMCIQQARVRGTRDPIYMYGAYAAAIREPEENLSLCPPLFCTFDMQRGHGYC